MGAYDDIIHLPHPTSARHPRMPMIDRAAQFSPFAALVGHGAAIEETARLTVRKIELTEDEKTLLDEKLRLLLETGGVDTPYSSPMASPWPLALLYSWSSSQSRPSIRPRYFFLM